MPFQVKGTGEYSDKRLEGSTIIHDDEDGYLEGKCIVYGALKCERTVTCEATNPWVKEDMKNVT